MFVRLGISLLVAGQASPVIGKYRPTHHHAILIQVQVTHWIGLIPSGYQRPRLVLTPQWWQPGNRLSPQRIVVVQTLHGVNIDPSGCADIFP